MKNIMFLILLLCSIIYSSSLDSTAFYVDSAVLETEKGEVIITFFEKEAPNHVENFKKLVGSGF